MVKISKRVDYGMEFLKTLAESGEKWVALTGIARKKKIPPKLLSRLGPVLAGVGIVDSREGFGGGYRLKKKPEEISVYRLMEILEGKTGVVKCAGCARAAICDQKPAWKAVQIRLDRVLCEVTLADLMRQA